MNFLSLGHRVIGRIEIIEDANNHRNTSTALVIRVLARSSEYLVIGEFIDFDGEFLAEDIKYLHEEGQRFGLDQLIEATIAFNTDDFDPEDYRFCDCEICMSTLEYREC